MSINNYNIGERLKGERSRLGLSASKMADIGGVVRTVQYNYEKNISKPNTDYLFKISEAGVDLLYLITGNRNGQQDGTLSLSESILLDNYRKAPDAAKRVLEATSVLLAQCPESKK